MLELTNNRICFTFNQCQQCGACRFVCPKDAISFEQRTDGLQNILIDDEKCIRCRKCVNVCPSHREVTATTEHDGYFATLPDKKYFFAYNDDNTIRRNSSSGGATRTIIIESLKSGFVDAVYTLRKTDKYPSAVGEFYTNENLPGYDDIPNSVYHSIMICNELEKVKPCNRLMIVGTSCQLYAMERALKGMYQELIKVCIFCKQQKNLNSTLWLGKAMGYKHLTPTHLTTCYRGEGWPGNLRVMDKKLPWEKAAILPFGRRLWTVGGCNVCGDPFGASIGADIALMDPWVIRQENELGESLAIVHTTVGLQLIAETPHLVAEEKSFEEVRPALGINDIRAKRLCVAWFRGEKVEPKVAKAAKTEMRTRRFLEKFLSISPKLPFICYRLLNKILPHSRNNI